MKILIVDELCYPQLGGIQVRFKGLAEQWVKIGHNVTITAIDHIGTLPTHEIINNVNYHRIIKDANYYKSGLFGRKISTIFNYAFKLKPYFKQEWDLIIFCQFPMLPQVFYKLFYKKKAATVLDFVEHRDSLPWKIINYCIINMADKVVCISNHVKGHVATYGSNNLHIMPSFVDESTSISKSKSNYIFLGRMEQHKHPELAIEGVIAYNKLYDKNMHLHLIGSGSMFEALKEQYRDSNNITFFGGVTEELKREILANGRILILPSEREGLPIAVIEAMSFGMPTVTTNYNGNGTKYFVEEENIGNVAEPDANSIANAIHEIEKDYLYFVEKCDNIRKDYDLEKVSENYLEIFDDTKRLL